MRDWALLDAAAAMQSYLATFPKISVVGPQLRRPGARPAAGARAHRRGAHRRLAERLLAATGRRSAALWMWPVTHFALPGVTRLHGYFPSSRFGFGEDLPKGVAIEWASWCRNPTYLVGALRVERRLRSLRRAAARSTPSATTRSARSAR